MVVALHKKMRSPDKSSIHERATGAAGLKDRPSGDRSTVAPQEPVPKEVGGPSGPEPTRYGDWERKGRCVDF
ncbi:MAG: DUF1674 domain-containing protein [Arenicellales bacterium]